MMLCCAVVHSIVWCGVLQTLEQTHSVRMCLIASFPNLASILGVYLFLFISGVGLIHRRNRCGRPTSLLDMNDVHLMTVSHYWTEIVSDVHCFFGASWLSGIHPPLPKHQESPSSHRTRPYSIAMVIRYRDSYDVAFVNVLGLCRVKTSGSYERMQLTQ